MNIFFYWLDLEGFFIKKEDTRCTYVLPKDFPGPHSGEFLKF